MPYNKGDFTQQGINGDVSALVRLNEKRVMKVVLSSDDESDNCDISGKIYDLLNGTSYDIGSGGGGGSEVLKTQFTVVNENDETANVPSTIMLYGYCVNMHDFSDVAPNRLLTNLDEDGNFVIQLSTLLPTVPANTTLTFDLFYVKTLMLESDCAIEIGESAGSQITNMEYDTDAYVVTDKTDNSAITYTITK